MSVDILWTSCDQCRSMVQQFFTSTETRRLVRTDSSGRPPRLSHRASRFGLAVSRGTSIRIGFGSPFSSKVVVCGHCLVTLSFTISETFLSTPKTLGRTSPVVKKKNSKLLDHLQEHDFFHTSQKQKEKELHVFQPSVSTACL